jgi:hypothetical protein
MPMQEFIEQYIDPLGMNTRLLAHTCSIISDNHGDRNAQRKEWILKSMINSNCKSRGCHQG